VRRPGALLNSGAGSGQSNDIRSKSRTVKLKHGVTLKEAQQIFDQVYLVDRKSDDPEQFRAIGWCGDRLCPVIFEIGCDEEGEH